MAMRISPQRGQLMLLVSALGLLPLPSPSAETPAPRSWPADPFSPLTPSRISALPDSERESWQTYWNASEQLARSLPRRALPDASQLKPRSGPPVGGAHTKGLRLDEPPDWYAGDEARAIAERVAAAQTSSGAWAKGMDYHLPSVETIRQAAAKANGTFDNNATLFELRFLARVVSAATPQIETKAWRAALDRGLAYVLSAQYPNGGFPQVYPLIGGYHDGVTFNDDVMVNILELLRDIAFGKAGYTFAPERLRQEAAVRLNRGVQCVLATQLKNTDGQLTVWCQQYDPLTLKPSAARNFEPIADASRESAAIALFLMSLPDPSPEIRTAVEGAISWFRKTALHDLRIPQAPADVRGAAIPAPGAPPIWARFYEPGTTTPIFGDRDRTIHYDLSHVSAERVAGYAWYTQAPAKAIEVYGKWRR